MKVLHILHDSLPVLSGYAVRSASIVRFQSLAGLETVVLTSPHHQSEVSEEEIDGIRYHRTAASNGAQLPFLREFSAIRQMIKRISEIVESEQPNVLHAHSPCIWGEATTRVARRFGLPFVYEIRGLWEDAAVDLGKTTRRSPRYLLTRALETRVARNATAVVTIGEHLKTEMVNRGVFESKITLVPNGVDTERFVPVAPDEQLRSQFNLRGNTCVGYVGTLHPWEGVEDLLHATEKVVAAVPNVKVLLVGTGSQESRIRELIQELHLSEHVQFVGKVPHEDVLRFYSVMDILAYPRRSTKNTELVTPLKPLEAMAMRKAVIGSDVGGIRELLPPGTGVTFQSENVDDLAKACIDLTTNPQKRDELGRAAREHVVQHRNWKSLASRYCQLYDGVIATRN